MASENLLGFKYLSTEQLAGFDTYKYKSLDTSPLSRYVMHPFWDRVVKLVPMSVAANTLTLVGWLLIVLVFTVLAYYDPNFLLPWSPEASSVPRCVFLLCGIGQFVAHTLDGIDGKQARRTGTGSPLGEMFDHGLDSSAVWLMSLSVISVFGVSAGTLTYWEYYYVELVLMFAFFVSHWEKYNTSVLYLPWAYDISQVFLAGAYLLTYLYGLDFWKEPLPGLGMTIAPLFKSVFFGMVFGLVIPFSLHNQYCARKYTPECCPSIVEGLMPMVTIVSANILWTAWAYVSHEDLVVTHSRMFLAAYGILYANINCRLIVAQMSSSLCDRVNLLAAPLPPIIACSYLQLASDANMLIAYSIFLALAHLHYGVCVVNQLCDHLNINCFSTEKKPRKESTNLANGHTSYESYGKSHKE